MALSVIGSGFGRTGTMSLKGAIEQLGFGPCHHMEEVFGHPEQVAHWQAIAAGRPVDWNAVFAGYRSQVDWPGAHVWRELAAAYPAGKVVHSVRPEESWWNSFSQTIGKVMTEYQDKPFPPHMRAMFEACEVMITRATFGGTPMDREAALAAYRRRTAEVRAAVPAERLLVFDVAEGWEPLCRFLGVPVPKTPFPHKNTTVEFWQLVSGGPPR
jgi:hypothetical protein